MAEVAPEKIRWLWPGRLPLGRISLIGGRPGEGKSFLTTDIAARVSTGSPWPDGSGNAPLGSVILVGAEDDAADTIRPRLDAHRADVNRIHLLEGVRLVGHEGELNEVAFTLRDAAALEEALIRVPDCQLVVIDPIGSFLGGGVDSHKDAEVRAVLAPVGRLAGQYGCAILIVAHWRKGRSDGADERILGSIGFTGIARTVWHLARDPQNKARRLLLPGKNNIAPEGGGLAFTIAGDPPAIDWERDPVDMSADEALAAADGDDEDRKPGPEPEALNSAKGWLATLLAGGEVEAARVRAETAAAGLAWRTVQRAADAIGVIREKNSFTGGWQWRLPKLSTPEDASRRCQVPQEHENLASWRLRENQRKNGGFLCQDPEDAKFNEPGILGETRGGDECRTNRQ
ncbi:AAA family ATPase [Fontivita pretiosa]|uniref:AAA family ATPase n=1 Tax=Fontivita pretiosa TaxID=2989684 RepID=UPI003D168FA1